MTELIGIAGARPPGIPRVASCWPERCASGALSAEPRFAREARPPHRCQAGHWTTPPQRTDLGDSIHAGTQRRRTAFEPSTRPTSDASIAKKACARRRSRGRPPARSSRLSRELHEILRRVPGGPPTSCSACRRSQSGRTSHHGAYVKPASASAVAISAWNRFLTQWRSPSRYRPVEGRDAADHPRRQLAASRSMAGRRSPNRSSP
jgi:hypothetical protein